MKRPKPITRAYLECASLREIRGLAFLRGIEPDGLSRDDLILELLKWAALERAK